MSRHSAQVTRARPQLHSIPDYRRFRHTKLASCFPCTLFMESHDVARDGMADEFHFIHTVG